MQPDDTARLGHLHDAARKAVTFAAGRSRDDLGSDEMLTLALTKLVEIVGEAAKQVTPELEPCTQPYRGPMLRELEIAWCTTTSTSTATANELCCRIALSHRQDGALRYRRAEPAASGAH